MQRTPGSLQGGQVEVADSHSPPQAEHNARNRRSSTGSGPVGRSVGPQLERVDSQLFGGSQSKLELMNQVICAINSSASGSRFQAALQQAVPPLLDCQTITLHVIDEQLRQSWAHQEGREEQPRAKSLDKGIVGSVATTGESSNISDVQHCNNFDPGTDGSEAQTMLCCPVSDVFGKRVAVIQAVNKRVGSFSDLDKQMLLTCCSHLGNVLSLSQLQASAMTDQQRMAMLCKGLQRLQRSMTLDLVVVNVLRAANELLQSQHLLLMFVDQANDRLWTRWYTGTTLASQGLTVTMRQPKDGPLARAMQYSRLIAERDISADSIATGFDQVVGLDDLASIIVQPITHQARKSTKIAVLIAVHTDAHAHVANDHEAASERAALDMLAIEVAGILAGRSEEISIAAAMAASATVQSTDRAVDSVLKAQLQTYVHSQPFKAMTTNPPPDMRTQASRSSSWLPMEEMSDSCSLEHDAGPGLLESLGPTPASSLSPLAAQALYVDTRQTKSKQGFTLSAWYAREIRVSQEASDSFTAQHEQPDTTPEDDTPVNSNPTSPKGWDVGSGRAAGRRALLMSSSKTRDPRRESLGTRIARELAQPGPVLAAQELLRWDTDFLKLSDDKIMDFIFNIFASSGLLDHFQLKEERLWMFIRGVAAHHRDNPYHNLCHTCYVLQATHLVMHAVQALNALPKAASFALLLAALCHDLDHDGHTNDFHVAAETDLARRYNDMSPMEMHHCATGYAILDDSSLLKHLSKPVQQEIRRIIIAAVMATDISEHFSLTSAFCQHGTSWMDPSPEDCLLLCKAILHAADLSNAARPFPVHVAMVLRLHKEFRAQAAEERQLGLASLPHMEAESQVVRSQMEASFISAVALPLWQQLAACFPALMRAVLRMEVNFNLHCALARLPEEDILQVYRMAEHDRLTGRLNSACWMHGQDTWQVRTTGPAALHITSAVPPSRHLVKRDSSTDAANGVTHHSTCRKPIVAAERI
ncbi:hypothetical protein WJX73_002873 [Symbiochloris irregularis]|uniref:Phosphodiesterase n=1 Tax=Symbiochloris irregularis TaxID=706552 RepID=A0AAW1P625_9CHLO